MNGWELDITWLIPALFGAGLLYMSAGNYLESKRKMKERLAIEAKRQEEIEEDKKALELEQKRQRNEAEHLNWMVQFHYAEGDSHKEN